MKSIQTHRRPTPKRSPTLIITLLTTSLPQSTAFAPTNPLLPPPTHSQSSTALAVFDFFKKAQESTAESFNAITTGLAKSRNAFLYNLEDALAGESGNLMDNLEDTLLQADLGMATTDDVLEEARILREGTEIFGRNDVKALLRGKLLEALGCAAGTEENKFALKFATEQDGIPLDASRTKPLTVHFIMGANGMGKTTTIGKLAHRLKTETEQKVLLAACDTFRAGAVAQLEQWAERAGVDCFSPTTTTNGPSAVLYGALDKALLENYDVLLVDTSGRLSNNDALTRELEKMKRVIQKRMALTLDEEKKPVPNLDTPHETLLVIDAAQGRMALDSAKQWDKEVGLTGLILTKLDGSAKGGSVVAVSRELGLPVKLVGVGERMEDLRDVSLFATSS
jgi:fused signal recognition particle receptor